MRAVGLKGVIVVAALFLVVTSTWTVAAQDARQFKIWWYADPTTAEGQMWAAALEVFKEENPNVEVEWQQKSFEQVRQNGALILSSDKAPDLTQYNQGTGDTGFLALNGLVTNLNEYAAQYDWDSKVPAGAQFTSRYDERGVMGSGDWYCVSAATPIFIVVYYNKDMFDEYELSVPTTLADFEQVLQTFVDNDITPISLAGGEYPGWQLWYQLVLAEADTTFVDNFMLFKGPVDFHGPEMTFGAEKFDEWVKAGYISNQAASVTASDANNAFVAGKYPILISGNWLHGTFQTQITDFDWSTFTFPGNQLFEGSGGNCLVVPSRSQNADLAAAFIDITLRPEMQAMMGNLGGVPINADIEDITNPKSQEIIQNFLDIQSGLSFWPDMTVPGYDPVLVNAFQTLINQTKTPDEVLDAIAKPYLDAADQYAQ